MIFKKKLYFPKSKRNVTLEISLPHYDSKNPVFMDVLYFLDGQNAFKDSSAAFGRSIRAGKYLNLFSKHTHHQMLGVAVYNAGSDLGRTNEYLPFSIATEEKTLWKEHQTQISKNFCDDFVHTLFPYIEKNYPVLQGKKHRFLYGSSLAAITALYTSFQYPDSFQVIGAFSTASFLCEKELFDFMKEKGNPESKVFLYVGLKETSDGAFDETLYYESTLRLHRQLQQLNVKHRLVISESGTHCEATWERQLLDFFSFIYEEEIIYKN